MAVHVYNPSCNSWTGLRVRVKELVELPVMVTSLFSDSLYTQVRLMYGDKLSSIVPLQIIENNSPIMGTPSFVMVITGTGRAEE